MELQRRGYYWTVCEEEKFRSCCRGGQEGVE